MPTIQSVVAKFDVDTTEVTTGGTIAGTEKTASISLNHVEDVTVARLIGFPGVMPGAEVVLLAPMIPTAPQGLLALEDDTQVTLRWDELEEPAGLYEWEGSVTIPDDVSLPVSGQVYTIRLEVYQRTVPGRGEPAIYADAQIAAVD